MARSLPAWICLVWLCGLSACVGSGSDAAAGGNGPNLGDWLGSDLAFHLENNVVSAVATQQVLSCTGDNGCKGNLAVTAVVGTAAIPHIGADFSWQLSTDKGPFVVSGRFSNGAQCSGTYSVKVSDCCTAVGAWSANWVPGSQPATPDVDAGPTGGGDAGPTGGSVKGWGSNSFGNWHPAPPRAVVKPSVAAGASGPQQAAAQTWEKLRAQMGLPPVVQHGALNQAAQNHADFYAAHKSQYDKTKTSPHDEVASFGSDFTGKGPGDRASAAGYANPAVFEVMAFTGSPSGAIAGWLETVYHRLPLLHPQTSEYGYGQAAGANKAEVIDGVQTGPASDQAFVYPWPGQTGVAQAWYGNEGPQPPSPPKGYPSGPVITARLPSGSAVTAHQLVDPQGAPVPHVWLDAKNDKWVAAFDAASVVLYAHQPLAAGTYTVQLDVQRGTEPKKLQWKFTVGGG